MVQISNNYLAIKDVEAMERTSLGLRLKRNYLLWRKVDCPLRNVRSVCSPPSTTILYPPPHIQTVTQRKGHARWFWGLAMREGPSFTSRLLLNSRAAWQGYKIQAIWELFGSLGPVPNEQVLTWKKLPVPRCCRRGAAALTEVCCILPPKKPCTQLCTPSHDLCLPAANQINQSTKR